MSVSLDRWRSRIAHGIARAWTRRELRWLSVILFLAAVLRIAWVLYAAREPAGTHDPIFYFGYGDAIAEGNGYALPAVPPIGAGSTAYYPIGYPAALGAVFALVKYTPIPENLVLTAAFFQVFLGVATVGFAYEVGRRLFGPAVGLLTALWLALFPNLIFHTATYLTETLFNFLVMAALLVLVSFDWRDRPFDPRRLLLFGALLGLSVLVRPIALLLLPLLFVVWLGAGFGWRRSVNGIGAVLVATAVIIVPWSIRNAVAMDAPVVISTNVGDNLCMGHYPGAPGHFAQPPACFADEDYAGLSRSEFEVRRNNDNIETALRFAFENPRFEPKLLSRKAFYTWESDHDGLWAVESYGDDPFIDPSLRTTLARIADVYFFVTISLGGLGLVTFVLSPRDPRRIFFLLALLAFAGVPLVFFGDSRFHVPVMPLLALSAAWLVVNVGAVPRLLSPASSGPASSGQGGQPSAPVEGAEGETSVAEQDALQDA